jgi:ribonuclease HIII
MEKEKIIDIAKNVEDKSNKDLFLVETELYNEFQKTRELILDLVTHLDNVETLYNNVNSEIEKRTRK